MKRGACRNAAQPQRTQACWVGMVSTNYPTRGYFRFQGIRTRPLAWLCATNWPTVLPGVIEKFPHEDPSASLKRGFGLTGRLLPRPCPGNPLNPDWEGASNRGFHRLLTKPTAHPRLRLWARPLRGPGGWGGDWYVWHAPDGLRARAATGLGCALRAAEVAWQEPSALRYPDNVVGTFDPF